MVYFTYIYPKYQANVGKYTIHGSYGHEMKCVSYLCSVVSIPMFYRSDWESMIG